MPRYVIIGAGALGASLAAQLHQHDIPSLLIGRPHQVALLRAQGLRYVRPTGASTIALDVATADEVDALDPDDIVVFTPKTQDLDLTLAQWAWRPVSDGRLVADLPAVTAQNGLAAERLALRRFATVLGASFNLPALHVEPGVVEVRSHPTVAVVTIGAFPPAPVPLAHTIARDCGGAGYAVEVVDDITRWKAAKLLFNVNNAVDVLGGDPDVIARLKDGLGAEARAALAAAGIDVADPSERTVDTSGFVISQRDPGRPGGMSTWQSFTRPGTTGHEVDYLNGELVLLGRLHGVPTPLNEALQRILGQSFLRREPPGTHDAGEVLRAAAVAV